MVVVSLRRLWRRGVDRQAVALRHHPEENQIDLVDYNDIRVALGIDFKRCTGQTGFVEGGYAFQRELDYASGLPSTFVPNGTAYVHAGVSF